ncbi:MAG: SRPBCC domain-containing protein [Saprospiraceae bacterium]|nr:SRPBCC domain-containing protein [Saprospiraceae bacterium]
MTRKVYTVNVKAPKEKCSDFMLGLTDKSTYEQWTAIFNPTSTYDGSWEKGSKIKFVGVGENGKRSGMVSRIAEHKPSEYVSIEHYGLFEDDVEIVEGPQVESWAGGQENYHFQTEGDTTGITVEVDVTEDHENWFDENFPLALEKLKEVIEKS